MIHSPLLEGIAFILIIANMLKAMFHFDYLQKYHNRFKGITFFDLQIGFKGLTFEHFYDNLVIMSPFPAEKIKDGTATMESEKLRKKIKFLVILIWIIVPIFFYLGIASFGDFGR